MSNNSATQGGGSGAHAGPITRSRRAQIDGEPPVESNGETAAGEESETVLGKRRAVEPLEKGERALPPGPIIPPSNDNSTGKARAPSPPPIPTQSCSICLDDFRLVQDPYKATLANTEADSVPFGMAIGDPSDEHWACVSCLASYIGNKLENKMQKAFPMECPGCKFEIDEDIAARCLGADNLEGWHHRKLLDEIPPYHCPNRDCSELVLRHPGYLDEPQGICPACNRAICVRCHSSWHGDMTCAEYQALPEDERNPEDVAFRRLAQQKGWKDCFHCGQPTERTVGCNHMTCGSCAQHFCYRCGGDWNPALSIGCKKVPPCPLFEEENLLDPEEAAEADREELGAHMERIRRIRADLDRIRRAPPRMRPVARNWEKVEAMHRIEEIIGATEQRAYHNFTTGLLNTNKCTYCGRQQPDQAALVQHLASTNHAVYGCCGKFYRAEDHLHQHIQTADREDHRPFLKAGRRQGLEANERQRLAELQGQGRGGLIPMQPRR